MSKLEKVLDNFNGAMKYSKWKQTRIKTLGSIEAYEEWMKERSAKGGRAKSPTKGFGKNKKFASKMGKIGGSKTKEDYKK